MPLHTIDDPKAAPPRGFALFALGFRPFFLLAGLSALVLLGLWLLFYFLPASGPAYFDGMIWHGHEMVFGYTVAVIAGFLLTAVRNWTGRETAKGGWLAALVAVWLSGRVLPLVPGLPPALVAAVDLAFLPLLALALLWPVLQARQAHNLQFALILAVMTGANALTHPVFELGPAWAFRGLHLAVALIVLLITVMGGRVIPFFIEKRLGAQRRSWPAVEVLAIASVALFAVSQFIAPRSDPTAIAALFAATVNAVRLAGWHQRGLWREPLLWVLFLGYAWVVAGLALQGLAVYRLVGANLAVHAFTAGGIGVLTLGMMPRVALGHTGRAMSAPRGLPAAFVLVNLGAALRVFGPLLVPAWYPHWVWLSGVVWALAFVPFVAVYAPMLLRPRVDGRPG